MSVLNADAGLQGIVVSFVVVAVGSEVADYTVSIVVSVIAQQALTRNSIVGLIGTTWSAGTQNPKVAIIAITLSVFEIAIDTTVLVAGAFTIDHSVSSITKAAVRIFFIVTVKRTHLNRFALSVDGRLTICTNTQCVDVCRTGGTNSLTETLHFSISRFAQASI